MDVLFEFTVSPYTLISCQNNGVILKDKLNKNYFFWFVKKLPRVKGNF